MKPSNGMGAGGSSANPFPRVPERWTDLWENWDYPRFLMNKSCAWIVEFFVPAQANLPSPLVLPRHRTRSRFKEWQQARKYPNGRPAHWRIVRLSRDDWEDVRRRDRMTMDGAVEAIRQEYLRLPHREYRIRNIKTDDIVLGAVLYADLRAQANARMAQMEGMNTASMAPKAMGGGSHSKN